MRNIATSNLASDDPLVNLAAAAAAALAFVGDAIAREAIGEIIARVTEPTAPPPPVRA